MKPMNIKNSDTYQHLYLLSDEEIKEGDWLYITDCKKIIATTNNSLQDFNFDPEKKLGNYLPQPSQAFLEVFVKEYNKGNVIKEVMVEYETYYTSCLLPSEQYRRERVRVNPKDNTITIKRVNELDELLHVIRLLTNKYGHLGPSKEILEKYEKVNRTNMAVN